MKESIPMIKCTKYAYDRIDNYSIIILSQQVKCSDYKSVCVSCVIPCKDAVVYSCGKLYYAACWLACIPYTSGNECIHSKLILLKLMISWKLMVSYDMQFHHKAFCLHEST